MSSLIKMIAIPLLTGLLSGLITSNSRETYMELVKPGFSPPGIVFPIVWTILYILMGVSAYLISKSDSKLKFNAYFLYVIQLVLNFFWSIIFFNYNLYFVSFWWLVLLIAVIIQMIIVFYQINKTAAYLQIPYLLWCIFAALLNFMIYILN